nr:hypothetical protein [bacterium]
MALNGLNNLSSLQNAVNAVSHNQTAAAIVAKENTVKTDGVNLSSKALKDAGSTVQMMYGVFNPLPGLEEGDKEPGPAQMMYGCFNPLPDLDGEDTPPTNMKYGIFRPDPEQDWPPMIGVKA